jgi:adenylate cyclase
MKRSSLRAVLVGLTIGILASMAAALGGPTRFASAVENRSYDLRVGQRAAAADSASPIVIVEINESSTRRLEPVVGRWPWPRMVHASAIDYLRRAGAKVIAYDVLFLENEGRSETTINGRAITGDDSDRALVNAVRQSGNVVLLAETVYEGQATPSDTGESDAPPSLPGVVYHPGTGFLARPKLTLPFADLSRVAAGVGHNYLARDESDAARRMAPFIETRGVAVPSLGLAAALVFAGASPADVKLDGHDLAMGRTRLPMLAEPVVSADGSTTRSRQALFRLTRPVNHPDGTRSIFPTYSFFDVVLSEDNALSGRPPVIPEAAFAGKLVFVGTTAAGTFDRYSTPFDGGAAGVELQATLADNVLSRSFMRRAPWRVDVAYTLVSGIAAGLAAVLAPVAVAALATIAMVAVLLVWLTREVGNGVWISALMPAASAALALFAGVAWRYVVEDREKRHIRRLFGRYVSNDVIEQLMSDPSRANLGGQRREMTVLFSDIRGFTAASERAAPEAVVAQLNEYFGAMVEVLFRHQGTLDKFVGDMVMGLFGAPLADDRHADHAVQAALDMTRTLDRLNERWRAEGKPALNIGIGINSGEMIAGNIGSESIMSYTVIGDAVNLGSRLESLNKEYGTRILVSDATRSRLTIDVVTRVMGEVVVKGRTQPVTVYEVAEAQGTKGTKEQTS